MRKLKKHGTKKAAHRLNTGFKALEIGSKAPGSTPHSGSRRADIVTAKSKPRKMY